jgi:hypothetical protein
MSLVGLAVIIGLEKLKVPGGILLTIIGVSIVGLIFDPTVHFSGIFAMPSLSDDKGNSLIGSLDIVGALNPVILPSGAGAGNARCLMPRAPSARWPVRLTCWIKTDRLLTAAKR